MSENTPSEGVSPDADPAPGTRPGTEDLPAEVVFPGTGPTPEAGRTTPGLSAEVDDPFPVAVGTLVGAPEAVDDVPTGSAGGGAPEADPASATATATARGPWWAPGVVAPSREDPVVAAASAVVGGPAGRRLAGAAGGWRAVSVLILFALAMAGLALVEKQHCRVEGWGAPDDYWHACYSDLPAIYSGSALGGDQRPSLGDVATTAQGQPPLAAVAMWFTSIGIEGRVDTAARRFFDVSVLFLTFCLFVGVAALAFTAGRRPWDAAHLALAPILVTVSFLNYDLLAVALLALSLLAWSRERPVVAGVFLALAAGCRPLYLVVLVGVLVLAARSGRWRGPLALSGVTLGLWFAVRVALLPGATGGLIASWKTWRAASTGYGSVWMVPNLLAASRPTNTRWWFRGDGLDPTTVTTLALVALALVLVATALLAMTAPRRPRLAHLCLILVVGALLISKSLPPQASLLVLPFLALAGFRWRDHLVWALAEVLYFVGVWMYIAASSDPNKGLPAWTYLVLLLGRVAALVWLAVQAARAIRNPELDPVRTPVEGPGTDDPLGGPLDGAPDALVVRLV